MIPNEKVQAIVSRHDILEKELSTGDIDPKNFADKSKEYSNLSSIIKYAREYFAQRVKTDINFLLISNLRTLTKSAIKRGGTKTDAKTIELIGCSLEQCRNHIQSQFDEKMEWDNWDRQGWHLDHIRPCSSFNLSE